VVVTMIAICSAPWVLAIAWIAWRHGLRLLVPQDDAVPSYGDLARRRSAVS
jgi:hypothetical protein